MKKNNTIKLVISIIIAILAILSVTFVLIIFDEQGESSNEGTNTSQRRLYNIVSYNGDKYERRNDITTLLIIGTDTSENRSSSYSQADFLAVLLLDEKNDSYNIIQINRDSMATVGKYTDTFGVYLGDEEMQITLSYAYGGDTDSKRAEHTMMAVENFLQLRINEYVCLNMDSIKSLIEYVDGITLTVPDDMTVIDESLKENSEVTFDSTNSALALSYLRARTSLKEENNEKRMTRQKVFCEAFISALQKKAITESFVADGYDLLENEIKTSMSEQEFVDCFMELKDYTLVETYFPQGTSNMEKQFVEYYVDKDKLLQYVIEHCYKER